MDDRAGTATFTRDAAGRVVTATDALGHTTGYAYDVAGRVVAITDPLGAVWTRSYDENGRLVTSTDPLGHVTSYGYDPAGRLVERRDATGAVVRHLHDASGRVSSLAGDVDIAIERDVLGRPVRITEPGVPEIGLGYDRSGRLVERRCGEATLRWSYDADGLQVGRTHPDGSTLVRDRDRAGRTVALTHPVLGRVECDRDPDGRGPRRGLPPATRLGGLWRISKRDCAEVAAMLMTYDRLNTGELRGSSQADYLVSLDADFQIREGDVVLYQETAFPVVELARSLLLWLSDPRRVDFQFESMSCEEVGSVEVRQISSGWVFGSIFTPGRSSGSVEWSEVERCSLEFVSRVEDDLLGLGLDPEVVIGR